MELKSRSLLDLNPVEHKPNFPVGAVYTLHFAPFCLKKRINILSNFTKYQALTAHEHATAEPIRRLQRMTGGPFY